MNIISKTDQKSYIINGEILHCPNEAYPLKPEVSYEDKKVVKVLLGNYATETASALQLLEVISKSFITSIKRVDLTAIYAI